MFSSHRLQIVVFICTIWVTLGESSKLTGNSDKSMRGKCQDACHALSSMLEDRVSFAGSTIYEDEQSQYWSLQQSTVLPACRVTPRSAEDVAITIRVLKTWECQFAVKSGGHAAFAGASNIQDAVTIDLGGLNGIDVKSDRLQVSVGAGAKWSDVYPVTDKAKLGVVGGRVPGIGVGGLTLGGGLSFFAGRYGFACDNVVNYQTVVADGTIQDINQTSNPDLYFALRGGGNNFGIVTRFDLAAFEQGDMWGGASTLNAAEMPRAIMALVDFNINHSQDPYAAAYVGYAYIASAGRSFGGVSLAYGKPIVSPPILKNFTGIPAVGSDLKITSLTDLVEVAEGSQPLGLRDSYWTFTIRNNAEMMNNIIKIFEEELPRIKNATKVLPGIMFQPLSKQMISHFAKHGGNALGVTEEDGPLIIVSITIAWADIADDERIQDFARISTSRCLNLATFWGIYFRYVYQNYASSEQNYYLFPSYGKENHQRLVEISRRYDPDGVFTRLQPGYFKIY